MIQHIKAITFSSFIFSVLSVGALLSFTACEKSQEEIDKRLSEIKHEKDKSEGKQNELNHEAEALVEQKNLLQQQEINVIEGKTGHNLNKISTDAQKAKARAEELEAKQKEQLDKVSGLEKQLDNIFHETNPDHPAVDAAIDDFINSETKIPPGTSYEDGKKMENSKEYLDRKAALLKVKGQVKTYLKGMNLLDSVRKLKAEGEDTKMKFEMIKLSLDQTIMGAYMAAKIRDSQNAKSPQFCNAVKEAVKLEKCGELPKDQKDPIEELINKQDAAVKSAKPHGDQSGNGQQQSQDPRVKTPQAPQAPQAPQNRSQQ